MKTLNFNGERKLLHESLKVQKLLNMEKGMINKAISRATPQRILKSSNYSLKLSILFR